jgi:hypothetical protein
MCLTASNNNANTANKHRNFFFKLLRMTQVCADYIEFGLKILLFIDLKIYDMLCIKFINFMN